MEEKGFIFSALSPGEPKGSCLDDDLGLLVIQKGQIQSLIFTQCSMEGVVGSAGPDLVCDKNKQPSGEKVARNSKETGLSNMGNKFCLI